MKINIKRIFTVIFTISLLLICSKVQAASANISATKTTATVDDNVTINVNINAAAWNLKVSGNGVSGGSIVGYDSDGNNKSTSQSYALNTSSAGTYTIYLTGDVTDGETDANTPINKSVTVTVNPKPVTPPNNGNTSGGGSTSGGNSGGSTSSGGGSTSSGGNTGTTTRPTTKPPTTPDPEPTPKSNDANLKGLAVEGYELYPEFNAGTKEYNLKVTNDITSINIVSTCNDNKATYRVEGNVEELQVGVNEFNIIVTAEDGTTNTYKVVVTREREALKVQSIKAFYIDKEGNTQEALLSPEFSEEVFEYTLDNLSYLVSKLDIEVLTNLEQAQIKVEGNENLVEGENLIKITVTIPSESEEEEDEVLTYEIIVNKEKEPTLTLIGKIKNWFKGITGTINTWFNTNKYNIVMGSLMLCSACMGGLTVYLIVDYKKYRKLIEKIKVITQFNNATPEHSQETESTSEIETESEVEIQELDDEESFTKSRGRHF